MLTVNEIFHSIQGESTFVGEACVFVRLTACDLRCSWCDTPYAFYEGRKMSIDEVMAEVDRLGAPLVEVTGGEPLLQPEVYPLMDRLLDAGKTVLLETGGHRSIEKVPEGVIRILDVKCPGSGESDKMDWDNLDRLTRADQVKFVIKDRTDYEYAREVLARGALATRVAAVLFSPVHGVLEPRVLAEWMLADRVPARLQLQAHKYIWSPDTRGV
jgi:7-carboxy-7-deazaguanine synthase